MENLECFLFETSIMTNKELSDQKKGEGNNVLVGIQIDSSSRELLNWALAKIAEPDDRVIAVLGYDDSEEDSNTLVHLIKSLKDYLAVYKGICSARKIDLVGQVSGGKSIRKVLVREAKLCGATTVVVGISKHNAFGGSLSLARYCAKMLLPCTSVLAIKDGKIVFQKYATATKPLPGLERTRRPSLRSILHPSLSVDVKVVITGHQEEADIDIQVSKATEMVNPRPGTCNSPDGSLKETKIEQDSRLPAIESFKKSDENESRGSSSSAFQSTVSMDGEDDHFYTALELPTEVTSSLNSHDARMSVENKPGWPLLRKATSSKPEMFMSDELRQMSVVEWVMQLPSRSAQSTPRSLIGSKTLPNPVGRPMSGCGDKPSKNRLSTWLEMPNELEVILIANSSSCKWFCSKDLQSSKTKFSKENLIGKGGCSQVYRGCLPSGKAAAVKIIKSSKEAWKNFLLEVDIITSLQHKNIIPLVGLCIEGDDLMSVYDYLPRGSLEENLQGRGKKSVLPWEARFKVAVGVAEALNYLHRTCCRPIIHRDVKSSNILLSDEYEPKLSDFGLAILAPTTSSYVTHNDVVGTFGYLAPEYFMYGKVSEKIDVYSYGVVLLELLSGRKPISTDGPKGQESLVMWATPILQSGDTTVLIDQKLDGHYDDNQMKQMVLAASLCTIRTARVRPPMSQILKLLQGDEDAVRWAMSRGDAYKEPDNQDDESYPSPSVHSHQLCLSLLEGDDDSTSVSSVEPNNHGSLEDYLQDRWSRSSSFD